MWIGLMLGLAAAGWIGARYWNGLAASLPGSNEDLVIAMHEDAGVRLRPAVEAGGAS